MRHSARRVKMAAVLAYDALLNRKRIIKTKSSYIDSKYILMDIYEGFLLWVIKNVRFVALIIAGIILGTCFIKMWHYGDVFSTEYLIVYINSNAICRCMAGECYLTD